MNQPREELIEATVFCAYHQVAHSFVYSLEENGLVELVIFEEQKYIPKAQLPQLEKIIRLHQELEINLSGVEVVIHMLHRMEQLHQTVTNLENRLRRYEG